LAGEFDRIGHDHILTMLGTFPARGMVAQWLKAGVVENGWLHRTEAGTPQGGVVGPMLLSKNPLRVGGRARWRADLVVHKLIVLAPARRTSSEGPSHGFETRRQHRRQS
jgi:hypothetical protein